MAGMSENAKVVLILLFFLLGTSNTIVTKVIFTLMGEGSDGILKPFHKPAFGNWNMFFGMALVLFPYMRQERRRQREALKFKPDSSLANLLDAGEVQAEMSRRDWAAFKKQSLSIAVPAVFDIVGTGLSLVGIILIPASVWQMLRGAEIVFAAILTITVLGRKLHGFHWLGVLFACAGIAAVSVATICGGSASATQAAGDGGNAQKLVIIGALVTLVSQIVQAAQIIAEEKLLVELDMDPLLVVSVEGLWGLLIMTLVVYPILWFAPGADNGHAEDPIDTYDMIMFSDPIKWFVVLDFLSCAVYNVLGQQITKEMSGMMRVMLEATRTMCVWVFNLGWHYFVDPKSMFGEEWTNWSYVELLGFVLLILGQMTYGEKVHWPFLTYPAATLESMASPLRASPRANLASFASPRPI